MDASILVKKIKYVEIQGAKNVALAGLHAIDIYASKIKSNDKKDFMKKLIYKSELVASARPTEPALRNAINFVMRRVSHCKDVEALRKTIPREIEKFSENIESAIKKIGKIGSRTITNNSVVFTHCHSNTVMEIFHQAKLDGKKFSVICTETRPINQGLLTAKQVASMRIPVTLVVDSGARTFIKKCDQVIVGADAITSAGNVVNKIGSATVALIAEELKKPLYVAASTQKIDPETANGSLEPIEERPEKEVLEKKIRGVKIKNPAFDVISAGRIKGIITEFGIITPKNIYKFIEK